MIKAKHGGQYKQVGFIKVRQPDGTYKDVEKKYGKTTGGEYGLVFEKGFTREKSGALPLQLDGIGKPLKDYSIEGNIYQSDGVSPDTPQEVVGVGERTGNLFKAPKYTSQTVLGVTWESNGDGTITVSGIASGYSTFKLADAYPIPSDCVGQNLTFNYRIGNVSNIVWAEIIFFDENYTEVGKYATGQTGAVTIKIEQNFKKVTATIKRNNDIETSGTIGLMINLGSTPLPYEPYGYKVDVTPPITTPIYLDSPLYKIGDYSDSRSKTEEVRVVRELVLTGDENWQYSTTMQTFWVANVPSDYNNYLINRTTTVCTHYRCIANNIGLTGMSNGDLRLYAKESNPVAHELYIKDIKYTTVDDFKAFLSEQYANGTPVTVYYVLATPEIKAVEPAEIPTLNGTTVIDVDAEVKPSNVYIKYKSKT